MVARTCRKCGVVLTAENTRTLGKRTRPAHGEAASDLTVYARGRMCAECARAYQRAHFQKHRERYCANQRAIRVKLRAEVLAAYGDRCACCGQDTPEFLTIDHINNDGKEHRAVLQNGRGGTAIYRDVKKLGFPKDRFQLLCCNCNLAKGFYGECPHQRDRDVVRGIPFAMSEVA